MNVLAAAEEKNITKISRFFTTKIIEDILIAQKNNTHM